MASRKLGKNSQSRGSAQQPTPPTQDELSDSYSGFESNDPMEKDETELELEKAVFGDEAGFLEELALHRLGTAAYSPESAAAASEEEKDFEGVDDADLFFLDTATSATRSKALDPPKSSEYDEDVENAGDAPAWVDSDDERMVVSLASNPRLRKLRHTEAEDLVTGREYIKRLRQQFERLYPVPEWANPPPRRKTSHKKRRKSFDESASSDNDGSASDMSVDSEDLSATPLAKLMQNTGSLLQNGSDHPDKRQELRPEVIDMQRLKDVGGAQPSTIESLTFHPSHPLILSSGPASTLYLHHISPHPPHPNPLLTSLHIRRTPISTSSFLPTTGSKIFFSGRRRYFHTWDLSSGKIEKVSNIYGHADQQRSMERFKLSPCGRWIGLFGSSRKGVGVINILNATTSQWIAEARVEGKGGVADFAWWGDGEGMVIVGKGGEAVEWAGNEKRVIARWIDEGAVGTTVVALGGRSPTSTNKNNNDSDPPLGGDRWIAVGSSSGIVNLYDRRAWCAQQQMPPRPKPLRVFDQLVTPISHLAFSTDGQLLCMASRWKRDALRLVHLPSGAVHRNWPTSGTPLGRVSAVAWSPTGEYLAVGNEQGRIRLWEVRG